MPLRPPAGFIRVDYNPLKVPDAPTGASASPSDASATVSFTAPANVGGGAITLYGVVAKNSSDNTTISATGASSPVTVTGLTNGATYTAAVWAINSFGPGPFSTFTGSFSPAIPVGLFGGGTNASGTNVNVIDKVIISTLGNASDFGDLAISRSFLAAFSSSTRAVFAGGKLNADPYTTYNVIEYCTFATSGNTSDFGDLLALADDPVGFSSSTRGIVAGGYANSTASNVIQYVTIATTGNATDFGDLITVSQGQSAGLSSSTRGVYSGGLSSGSFVNVIQYVTIATTGNATDFGDLLAAIGRHAGCSSSTRGLFSGGLNASSTFLNVIQYITIATTGNSIDFGDLTSTVLRSGACSSTTRGLIGGGVNASAVINIVDYVTISTTGNAADFGDLSVARQILASCSSAHGGL